jgi:hypothetical protein
MPLIGVHLAGAGSPLAVASLGFAVVEYAVWIVGAVLFCRWLYRAYEDNQRLGGLPLKLSPAYAVGSFFIPVVNLWQPYQALRDLYVASDPRPLPDPPRFLATTDVLYRSSGRELIAPPNWNKPFPVRAWWACYMVLPWALTAVTAVEAFWGISASPSAGLSRFSSVTGVLSMTLQLGSVVLVVLVIRSIQARQEERLRRLEGA